MYCPVCHSDWPSDWKVCPKDEATLLRSKAIGKYTIEGLLGVGGMGAVYRAVNPDTHSAVAIKVMNAAVASSDQARQRFQREAAVVAKLRTSHVVKIFDFGAEADGSMYLVMEKLDGHQLRDEITPGPDYMDLARVYMVMDGALKGLGAAHKAGIVHRDLKPENIHVAETDDGEVPKLLDFGIARVRTRESDLTRTGSLMGTASYMAPEQITAGHSDVGPWTDIYAMGAILYEMLTGTACFGGATVTEVLQRVLRSEHVPLAAVRSGLPPGVYPFVERCLDPVAANRPQDAESMRMQLAAAQLVTPGVVIPPANRTRPDHKAPPSTPGLDRTQGVDGAVRAPVDAAADRSAPVVMPYQAAGASHLALTPQPKMTPSPDLPSAELTPARTAAVKPKKPIWPFALAGVAVVGIGAVIAIKAAGGSSSTVKPPPPPPADAQAVAVVSVDAALPDAAAAHGSESAPGGAAHADDVRDKMIHLPAGKHHVGEKPDANGMAVLPEADVELGELWIDRTEMTLGELRAALKSNAGGMPKDAPAMPARMVTYAQAGAACKAVGKRLPTEQEWEVAALTSKADPSKATMKQALVPSKHVECSYDGLCDMLGSVAEWTSSDGDKGEKIMRGSTFKVSATMGGWLATIHARASVPVTEADDDLGFRCAIGP